MRLVFGTASELFHTPLPEDSSPSPHLIGSRAIGHRADAVELTIEGLRLHPEDDQCRWATREIASPFPDTRRVEHERQRGE